MKQQHPTLTLEETAVQDLVSHLRGALLRPGDAGYEQALRVYKGKLGATLSIEDGRAATRACVINCLAAIKSVIGSLDVEERTGGMLPTASRTGQLF